MKRQSKFTQIVSGVALLALLLFMTWLFIDAIITSISKLQSAVAGSIITATIAAIAAFLVNVYVKHRESKEKLAQEIRTKKVPLYEEFINVIFASLESTMLGGPPLSEDELKQKLIAIMPRLITWGSEDLINQWNRIRSHDWSDTSNPATILGPWNDFLLVIRKDLGHSSSKLENFALMKLYVKDWNASTNTAKPETTAHT